MGESYGKQPAGKPESSTQTGSRPTTPVTIFHFFFSLVKFLFSELFTGYTEKRFYLTHRRRVFNLAEGRGNRLKSSKTTVGSMEKAKTKTSPAVL
jgi:hypothetical protein